MLLLARVTTLRFQMLGIYNSTVQHCAHHAHCSRMVWGQSWAQYYRQKFGMYNYANGQLHMQKQWHAGQPFPNGSHSRMIICIGVYVHLGRSLESVCTQHAVHIQSYASTMH